MNWWFKPIKVKLSLGLKIYFIVLIIYYSILFTMIILDRFGNRMDECCGFRYIMYSPWAKTIAGQAAG